MMVKVTSDLLFGTASSISEANTYYVNGTFCATPLMFYQLFTMHIKHNQAFPLVYDLLPNKRQPHSLILLLQKVGSAGLHSDGRSRADRGTFLAQPYCTLDKLDEQVSCVASTTWLYMYRSTLRTHLQHTLQKNVHVGRCWQTKRSHKVHLSLHDNTWPRQWMVGHCAHYYDSVIHRHKIMTSLAVHQKSVKESIPDGKESRSRLTTVLPSTIWHTVYNKKMLENISPAREQRRHGFLLKASKTLLGNSWQQQITQTSLTK